jgi:hypothetical protein
MEPSNAAKAEALAGALQSAPVAEPMRIQRTAELISIVQRGNDASTGATPRDAVSATATAVQAPVAGQAVLETSAAKQAKPHRSNHWFAALCAVVALLAAVVALAAPALRPQADALARKWLGPDNPVSRLVAPAAAASVSADPAVTEEVLRASLAGYDTRIQTVSDSLRGMENELTGAVAALHAAADGTASLSAAMKELRQHTDRLQSANAVLEERARTASVLALAVNLRRGIDAGLPVGEECAALHARSGGWFRCG